VPSELFPQTLKWACYTIAHKAVALSRKGSIRLGNIKVGKDMPPHPGDLLATLWDETDHLKAEVECFIKLPEVSLPMTVLHSLSPHHRQVFLTANVLITMRQALDAPSLSTEDHLKFQGLDISAGAQLMEVLGSELDHALPLDWPKSYGTVASLSAQAATFVSELQPERIKGHGNPAKAKKEKATGLAGAVAAEADKAKAGDEKPKAKSKPKAKGKAKAKAKRGKKVATKECVDEMGSLAHFNRKATFRLVQQIAFFMRDQDDMVQAVLAAEEGDVAGQGVRTSRYITVTEKLFQMADNSKHDHCSFILAVVMFHLVLRGLMLRVMYHRAAVCVQKRYRYLKSRGNKANQVAPVITIQRFWRGLREALLTMRMIDAGTKIWMNYKTYRINKRSKKLVAATLRIQRCWRGGLGRQWLRHCHEAATFVQKFVRRLLVGVVLDKPGRDIARRYQKELNQILKNKKNVSETEHIARCSALSGKAQLGMEKQRNRNVDMRRALSFNLRSKHTRKQDREKMMKNVGRVQTQRATIFEPMVVAMARMQPDRLPPRVGCKQSRVLKLVRNAEILLDKSLPPTEEATSRSKSSWVCPFRQIDNATGLAGDICKTVNPTGMRNCSCCHNRKYEIPHGATVRGRAAMIAMRLAKTPKMKDPKTPLVNIDMVGGWGSRMFTTSSNA